LFVIDGMFVVTAIVQRTLFNYLTTLCSLLLNVVMNNHVSILLSLDAPCDQYVLSKGLLTKEQLYSL
jgi:hypothetical protein